MQRHAAEPGPRRPRRRPSAGRIAHADASTPSPRSRRHDLLLELLKDNNIFSAIAFTRTKARANRLAAHLAKSNIPSDVIHGDRSQAQRTRALRDFKRGKFRVLVATDIAARGIDIAELGHVVNFDVPMVPEDYVHRVGRTARAKATGDAITFVASDEEPLIQQDRVPDRADPRTRNQPALPRRSRRRAQAPRRLPVAAPSPLSLKTRPRSDQTVRF